MVPKANEFFTVLVNVCEIKKLPDTEVLNKLLYFPPIFNQSQSFN